MIDKILRLLSKLFISDREAPLASPTADEMYQVVPDLIPVGMITAAMPRVSSDWIPIIQNKFYINEISGDEAALLLAHIGHESSDLTRLEENLNYSAERLMQVWPSRFKTIERAGQYERNPEALANEVYGGRMGNTRAGDGWLFRGRGPIQITGRDNYARLEEETGLSVLRDPDLLCHDRQAGIMSAIWYWQTRVNLHDINGSTRQINGGINGLSDRLARYNAARQYT